MCSQKICISIVLLSIVVSCLQFASIEVTYAQTADNSKQNLETKEAANGNVVEVHWHEILPGQEIKDIRTGKTTRVWTTRGPVARYRNRDFRNNLDDFDSLNIEIDSTAAGNHKTTVD